MAIDLTGDITVAQQVHAAPRRVGKKAMVLIEHGFKPSVMDL